MNRSKSTIKALGMTGWFLKNSWSYIVTKKLSSKVKFLKGLIPAWAKFTIATYKDCRLNTN